MALTWKCCLLSQPTISRYDRGALSASANSEALALTLALRVLIVLIASLILFLGRCFGFLIDPFICPREKGPVFRGSQGSFGTLRMGLGCGSPACGSVSYASSLNSGNLSIGLAIGCELDVFVGGCHSGCSIEERRPVPVTVVVLIQVALYYKLRKNTSAYCPHICFASFECPGIQTHAREWLVDREDLTGEALVAVPMKRNGRTEFQDGNSSVANEH